MGSGGLASHLASTGERHSTLAKTLKSLGRGAAIGAGKVTRAMPTVRVAWCGTPAPTACVRRSRRNRRRQSATSKAEMDLIEKRLKDLIDEKEKQ
jgi:hypothetical protein